LRRNGNRERYGHGLRISSALIGVIAAMALVPAAAHGQSAPTPNAPSGVEAQAVERAFPVAASHPKVVEMLQEHPGAQSQVLPGAPGKIRFAWGTPADGELVDVTVDKATNTVVEAWTGPQIVWPMARGYPGAFGRAVNSPWVWITLTVLFLAPFLRGRPRWLHVDLAALAAFGISVAFFNDANIDASVPIASALLLYLLARMLAIGYRCRQPLDERAEPPALALWVSPKWLAVVLVLLVLGRIGLNVSGSDVIDVGISSVVGAGQIAKGEKIYGNLPGLYPHGDERGDTYGDTHGDTYGPVVYEAYLPFERALPWKGQPTKAAAANVAAIVFDLLALLLLFLTGRRIRGPGLGIVLAYLWAAWPFSAYVLCCNANDGLVAALAAATLYVAARPGARGVIAALAGLAKLGALGLAPLLATHGAPSGHVGGRIARFTAAFAATALVVSLPIILRGESLHTIYDRTIVFQANRGSPFSVWGLHELTAPQHVWQAAAVVFALSAAFLPRRKDIVGLAAVAAAVLIAVELGLNYWFYLYLVWFFPFMVVAVFARYRVGDPAETVVEQDAGASTAMAVKRPPSAVPMVSAHVARAYRRVD
jgi:hypothetical protein